MLCTAFPFARFQLPGIRTGVALNPATPLEAVTNVWYLTDLLVGMTVGAGFGNQQQAGMGPKIAAGRAESTAAIWKSRSHWRNHRRDDRGGRPGRRNGLVRGLGSVQRAGAR